MLAVVRASNGFIIVLDRVLISKEGVAKLRRYNSNNNANSNNRIGSRRGGGQ